MLVLALILMPVILSVIGHLQSFALPSRDKRIPGGFPNVLIVADKNTDQFANLGIFRKSEFSPSPTAYSTGMYWYTPADQVAICHQVTGLRADSQRSRLTTSRSGGADTRPRKSAHLMQPKTAKLPVGLAVAGFPGLFATARRSYCRSVNVR